MTAVAARTLDGRALSQRVFDDVAALVAKRLQAGKPRPVLATVLVGDNKSSDLYVRSKQKNAKAVGIDTRDHRLAATTTTDELCTLVASLNSDADVSGVLIQQPV